MPTVTIRWLVVYYIVQMACQILLLTAWAAPLRIVFRTVAFTASLAMLGLLWGRGDKRPAPPASWAYGVLAIVALEVLHPLTSSPIAGFATLAFYAAILAPVWWVPRLSITAKNLGALILLLWTFQTASAAVGALQVYFPGSFQPAIASVLDANYVSSLRISLADGTRVFRPMGLTDTPGGAGMGAVYSVLLGVGLLLNDTRRWLRAIVIAGMATAMFSLYLCQVRALVVMLAISLTVAFGALGLRGGVRGSVAVVIGVGVIAVASYVVAAGIGGDAVTRRLSSLVEKNAGAVYYQNRGFFLEATLTELLPQYPLGAGLGRWGMMHTYFSDPANRSSYQMHAEIQWTGWLFDGGVPLILAYCGAVAVACFRTIKIVFTSHRTVVPWACIILGYNAGTLALTFSYAVFMSVLGIDFWILNCALLAVVASEANDTLPTSERAQPGSPTLAAMRHE